MHFPTVAVCANCGGERCRYSALDLCNEAVQMTVGPGYVRCGKVAAFTVRATSGLQEPRCEYHGDLYPSDRKERRHA